MKNKDGSNETRIICTCLYFLMLHKLWKVTTMYTVVKIETEEGGKKKLLLLKKHLEETFS